VLAFTNDYIISDIYYIAISF